MNPKECPSHLVFRLAKFGQNNIKVLIPYYLGKPRRALQYCMLPEPGLLCAGGQYFQDS